MTSVADGLPPPVDPARLCQIELQVQDVRRMLRFFEEAFGWRPSPVELHQYHPLDVPRHCPFGLALVPAQTSAPTPRGRLLLYFQVDSPEPVVTAVTAAGGRLVRGPVPLPGYGEVWQVEDPEGNRWGLYRRSAGAGG